MAEKHLPKLTKESLDFARLHVTKFYDSDFFPKPFEYQALWANWDQVVTHLTCTDINGQSIEQPRTYAASKPNGTFRIVHQLDPINALTYTAFSYLIGESIEQARTPVSSGVACAYRISINEYSGTLFANGSGYPTFIERCYALSENFKFVLATDITDFYNQIYVHRLQNAIENSNQELLNLSKDIERFILDLNGSVSQGVPVGPAASIVMAEALLIDVDNFILNHGCQFTRYVDDFRIFSNSESELRILLQKLTEYLYHNHRLTLAGSKTKILGTTDFRDGYLNNLETIENQRVHTELQKIQSRSDAYSNNNEDESDTEDLRPKVLDELAEYVVSLEQLDLGLARHILRRCRKYKIRAIANRVIDNFCFFSPVISDVVLYLDAITNKKFAEGMHERFLRLYAENDSLIHPFTREWLDHYFANNKHFVEIDAIKKHILANASIRNQAALARNLSLNHWVREKKGHLSSFSTWDRRGVIRSASALSKDEMNSWFNALEKNTGNFMELMTIKWMRSAKNA